MGKIILGTGCWSDHADDSGMRTTNPTHAYSGIPLASGIHLARAIRAGVDRLELASVHERADRYSRATRIWLTLIVDSPRRSPTDSGTFSAARGSVISAQDRRVPAPVSRAAEQPGEPSPQQASGLVDAESR